MGAGARGFFWWKKWKNWHYCCSKERVNPLPWHAMGCGRRSRGWTSWGRCQRSCPAPGDLPSQRNLPGGLNSFSRGAAPTGGLATAGDPAWTSVSHPAGTGGCEQLWRNSGCGVLSHHRRVSSAPLAGAVTTYRGKNFRITFHEELGLVVQQLLRALGFTRLEYSIEMERWLKPRGWVRLLAPQCLVRFGVLTRAEGGPELLGWRRSIVRCCWMLSGMSACYWEIYFIFWWNWGFFEAEM